MSGVGCGICLWLFLDFSIYLFSKLDMLSFLLQTARGTSRKFWTNMWYSAAEPYRIAENHKNWLFCCCCFFFLFLCTGMLCYALTQPHIWIHKHIEIAYRKHIVHASACFIRNQVHCIWVSLIQLTKARQSVTVILHVSAGFVVTAFLWKLNTIPV